MKKNKNRFTKFWRGNLPILATMIAFALTCLLSGQWLVFRCLWWECVDSGYFDSQEIQLPREFFPDEAVYGKLGPDRNTFGAKQHQVQQIFWGVHNNSTVLLHVYRYFGMSGAKKGFATQVRILDELFDISSEQSGELNYQSTSAGQLFLGCGEKFTQSGYQCVFVARYEENLVSLSMTVDEQMTLKDFERIITYLDTVSAERLGH